MKPTDPVSQYFTYAEVVRSQTADRLGLDNVPSANVFETCLRTASKMDAVRRLLGVPITVTSWYRSPDLNHAIGSSPTSQHIRGEAVDFVAPRYGTPAQIVHRLMEIGAQYDQLILEFADRPSGGWVHVSWTDKPRMQVLAIDGNGTRVLA